MISSTYIYRQTAKIQNVASDTKWLPSVVQNNRLSIDCAFTGGSPRQLEKTIDVKDNGGRTKCGGPARFLQVSNSVPTAFLHDFVQDDCSLAVGRLQEDCRKTA